MTKTIIREKIKNIRDKVFVDDLLIEKLLYNVYGVIKKAIPSKGVVEVGIYEPINNEVPIDKVMEQLKLKDEPFYERLNFCVPKVIKSGIMVFVGKENQEVIPSIVIAPMVAFDHSLNRLGYGGGYYDRYLEKHKGEVSFVIGIAYDEQEVELLPCENHDQKMDMIITQSKIIGAFDLL